ncbi:hypothetical protein [Cryobacterium aureum]|uniref:hypothetical protein n=1 Tax=Cryobacterium aureum TaxID=995037 RepID=UPI000CF4666D|nr:hypothetical protein [Cryobacterium aureum]
MPASAAAEPGVVPAAGVERQAVLDTGRSAMVIETGCAAPDLKFGGERVAGRLVHLAFASARRDAGAAAVTWPLG